MSIPLWYTYSFYYDIIFITNSYNCSPAVYILNDNKVSLREYLVEDSMMKLTLQKANSLFCTD